MAAAREHGYLTAVLGKVGPGIQDVTQLEANTTIFFDDDTARRTGIVLRPDVIEQRKKAGLQVETIEPRHGSRIANDQNQRARRQGGYRCSTCGPFGLNAISAVGRPPDQAS